MFYNNLRYLHGLEVDKKKYSNARFFMENVKFVKMQLKNRET